MDERDYKAMNEELNRCGKNGGVGGSATLRKVAGYLCLSIFYGVGILAFYDNIKEDGWYFVISMIGIAVYLGVGILGYFLIKGGR